MEIDHNIFFEEVMEKLKELEISIINAKMDLNDGEIVNEIFRAIHTLKGVSDLLGFVDVVRIAHKAEDVLDQIRNKKIALTLELCDLLFELKKVLTIVIEDIASGPDLDDDVVELLNKFYDELSLFMPKTVLVIDDSEFIKNLVHDVQTKTKFNIITALNQIDAQVILKKQNVSLLFADFHKDRQASLATVIKLRRDPKYHKLPIVILTDENKTDLQFVGKVTSAKAWLAKPFEEKQFLFIINKFLAT